MAEAKYDWKVIRADYDAEKYKTLKDLAEAYGVNYSYMKKKASTWKRENKLAKQVLCDELSFMQEEEKQAIMYDLDSIPDDREAWHKRLWDKLGLAAERALDDMENNFYTADGKLKSKALADVAAVLDKIQKGHQELKDEGNNGQLNEYAKLIQNYRNNVTNNKEGEDDEEE